MCWSTAGMRSACTLLWTKNVHVAQVRQQSHNKRLGHTAGMQHTLDLPMKMEKSVLSPRWSTKRSHAAGLRVSAKSCGARMHCQPLLHITQQRRCKNTAEQGHPACVCVERNYTGMCINSPQTLNSSLCLLSIPWISPAL